jgi:flagellar hook assembly protein FlgD
MSQMLKKKIYLLFLILIINFKVFSQNFGNEWINYNLKYSKITISAEGIYKITFNEVLAKNFAAGNLNPNNFRLFSKGIEIPLYITGTQDNAFNQGDLIYFYGTKNDAYLDKILYNNPLDLPNDDVSLFSDDNIFFLTYDINGTGLRFDLQNLNGNGLIEENFIIGLERQNFANAYYPGAFILEGMSLSEYTMGEGYLGGTLSKGQVVNYQFNTSNFISTLNNENKLSFYFAGRSNASSINSQGLNHHLRINANNITLFDTLYRGYNVIRKTIPVQISNSNFVANANIIDDISAVTDFQAPGYFYLEYSRNLNLSNQKFLSFKLNASKSLAQLNFVSSSLVSPVLLEKNGKNIYLANASNTISFVLKNTSPSFTYFLADLNDAQNVTLNSVTFKNINTSSSKNYLIVSNTTLADGANAYNSYNQSIGISSSLVFTEDLYNEFYYGFHNPMAIKNYCRFMIQNGNQKPEYLLLLGKGYETPKGNLNKDLVPTIGFPASDNMLTSGLNGSLLEPGLATGRVPAITNTDILNYIDKLKTYRNLPDSLWRKKITHVSGGRTFSENLSFQNYQNVLADVAKNQFLGATLFNVKKNVNAPVTENFTDVIVRETRKGTGLISFLGHGSSITTEIVLGDPQTLNNKNKPTIYIVNGCSTGQAFTSTKSLSEQFVLQKDFGAVGWIGTTSEGVASYLNNASNRFYLNWFKNSYGESFAKGIQKGLKEYQNGNDVLNLAHLRQYIFIGDPLLKPYSPALPDFELKRNSAFETISNQNVNNQFLQVSLILNNNGKVITDSLEVEITRTLPNNTVIKLPIFKVKPILNIDTLNFNLLNNIAGIAGANKINFKLDPQNEYNEINEINNETILEIFLPGNGVNIIWPLNNGIASNQNLQFKAQPDDLFTKSNTEYIFELDTTINFNSNLKRSSGIFTAGLFPTWEPNFSFTNLTTYYWRVRLNLPFDQGGAWSTGVFTFINNSSIGFTASSYNQLKNYKLVNIELGNSYLEFVPDIFPTSIQTRGDDLDQSDERRYRYGGIGLGYNTNEFTGITIVSYHPQRYGERFSYPSPYNYQNFVGPIIGYTGQYYWNTNNPIEADSLLRYLKQIPNDYYLIGHNGLNAAFNELNNEIKTELSKFGFTKFNLVNRGEPYMFWGKKGAQSGSVTEVTADYNSTTPPRLQLIKQFVDLTYKSSFGSITSTKIGPSNNWNTFISNYTLRNNDQISFDIIGIDNQNNERTLLNVLTNNSLTNIATIDAKTFPYLKIKTNFKNEILRTIPSINFEKVNFETVPELSFNPELKSVFLSNEFAEGDSLKVSMGIINLNNVIASDSISIYHQITKADNSKARQLLKVIKGLDALQAISFDLNISTRNLVGTNSLELSILQKGNTEIHSFNNIFSKQFKVIKDIREPIINVQFDGKNIINGDIVSPSPDISITTVDENRFLLISDTSLVEVFLKHGQDFKRISYSNGTLVFNNLATKENNKALIVYKPNQLQDGDYTLKIKSKDVSGNFNPTQDYEIDFKVINESTISNFYPYPNPVINSMKFVFTITGSKIPDDIKIQILNSKGNVLREIFKTELGSLRIGNNISDFTWDGTDQYGDRLANGVYFYKVIIKEDNNSFKNLATGNSQMFKNNIGKIYLLK